MEENATLLQEAKQYLSSTCKWYRFFAIMSIVGAAFMVISGLTMLFTPSLMADSYPELSLRYESTLEDEFASSMYYMGPAIDTGDASTTVITIMGVIYLFLAALLVVPAIFLFRAARAGSNAIDSESNAEFVTFLHNSKNYWKFYGIFTIIAIGLAIVATIVGVFVAAASL